MLNSIKPYISEHRWAILGAIFVMGCYYALFIHPDEKRLYGVMACMQDGSEIEYDRCSGVAQ